MKSGPALVLEALRRAGGKTCSGQALSRLQGVSRAQVWKHVEALRALGYKIEAAPGDGYRLSEVPDRLFPEEIHAGLETAWLARDIHYFDRTDSTRTIATRHPAPHGDGAPFSPGVFDVSPELSAGLQAGCGGARNAGREEARARRGRPIESRVR